MSAISHRPYAGLSDLYAMKDTLTANWRAGYASYHRGDLDWWLLPEELGVSPEEMIEIWFTAKGNCLGWVVFVEARADYDVVMHPDWRGSALERKLLRWADARLTAAARQHGKTRVRALRRRKTRVRALRRRKTRVCAFVFADNPFQRAILREMGYTEADDVILYSQPLPPQPLPPQPLLPIALPTGFHWLPPMRVEWAAARAAAHADAFHPSKISPAAYRRFMRNAPDYEGELDVVAVAPDGQHVAFAKVWLDEETAEGLFEPVGTRRAYQRRGLGRAVFREGLRRMCARGMTQAIVGCDANNEGTQAFYRGAGFREQTRILCCRRELAVKSA